MVIQCKHCNKVYKYDSGLRKHNKSDLHKKRIAMIKNQNKCNICGNGYITDTNLQKHMLMHKNEKETKDSEEDIKEEYEEPIPPPVHINTRLQFAERYKYEALQIQKNMGKDVLYIFQLHPEDVCDIRIYKYGITDRLLKRGDEHRKRFKCAVTLEFSITMEVSRTLLTNLEASLGWFTSRIGLREKYMKSNETFIINENDTTSFDEVVSFIHEIIPQDNDMENELDKKKELKKIEDDKITLEKEKLIHTYTNQIIKLKTELENLELLRSELLQESPPKYKQ